MDGLLQGRRTAGFTAWTPKPASSAGVVHVAPKERRIIVFEDLSSAWPVQSILVHGGTVFATAGLMGRLEDGSAMVALNALTGANLWTKTYKDDGEHWENGTPKLKTPNAGGGGQLAWYSGKVWWMAGEYGPCVIDPANGNLTSAVDESYWPTLMSHANGSWYRCSGPEIGILPGGWVAIGRRNPASGYAMSHVLLRSGPNGIPSGGAFAPQLFSFNDKGGSYHGTFTGREIPVWDDASVLVSGEERKEPPMFYPATGSNSLPQTLNALGDSIQVTADACRFKPTELLEKSNLVLPPPATTAAPAPAARATPPPLTLTGCPGKQAVSDALWKTINDWSWNGRTTCLYGTPVMSGNALLWTVFRYRQGGADPELAYNGRMSEVNSEQWRVLAVSRTDQSILFTVNLPGTPSPNGMSLTRNGEVLVPLVDGRVACIGKGVAQPLAAASVTKTVPALQMEEFPTDIMGGYYSKWTPEDLDGMTPVKKGVASLPYKESDPNTLVWLRGYLKIPTTGTYTFTAWGTGVFKILDASKRCIVSSDSAPILLEAGLHPISTILQPGKKGTSLTVQWSGPNITRANVPESALSHRDEPTTATQP